MNKRSLTVLFGAVSALILSACIITGTGSGGVGGGTAGTGGETGGTGSDMTGGVGGGTTGSSMSCDMTYKCATAITPPEGDPTKLCDMTESATLYDAYYACVCTDSCKTECGDTACAEKTPSYACNTCRGDKCKKQLDACSNDL